MGAEKTPAGHRTADYFSHIDIGFINERLALSALGPLTQDFADRRLPGDDFMTRLSNRHLIVTMLIDIYDHLGVRTLAEALKAGADRLVFMSVERLEPCPSVYDAQRVEHAIIFDFEVEKRVVLSYHTSHLVADTFKEALDGGHLRRGARVAVLGLLHDRGEHFEVEPIVMGFPTLDHPRNPDGSILSWHSRNYGELLPEDIDQFSKMASVEVSNADEWLTVMRGLPEERVKESIAKLLSEPPKKDWGGEDNDHFSANLTVAGRRRTGAFLLKGPTNFREMTPAMCGKNGDQIYRLVRSGADISIVQHSHMVGSAVRETLRSFVVAPGTRHRKFVIIDGQATYRLLKAYGLLA